MTSICLKGSELVMKDKYMVMTSEERLHHPNGGGQKKIEKRTLSSVKYVNFVNCFFRLHRMICSCQQVVLIIILS